MKLVLLSSTFLIFVIISPVACNDVICPSDCACVKAGPTISGLNVTCRGGQYFRFLAPFHINDVTASQIRSLELTGNRILDGHLKPELLSGLVNLIALNLSRNGLDVVDRDALDPVLGTLWTLDLSHNRLESMENLTGSCRNCVRIPCPLQRLDLSFNRLSRLDRFAFDGLSSLTQIDLHNNRMSFIDVQSFHGLDSLQRLNLADNLLPGFSRMSVVHLSGLVHVVLRGNPLSQLQFVFDHVTYVDASECQLTGAPSGLPRTLRYLQLRRNNITRIGGRDDCFGSTSTPDLSVIVLDENQIDDADFSAFDTVSGSLRQVWLNRNRLSAVPRQLPATVRSLYTDGNQLSSLTSGDFPDVGVSYQLRTLSLVGNHIAAVTSDSLRQLTSLELLDLTGNRLRALHAGTFEMNSRLKTLRLSKNPLESLPAGSLEGLGSSLNVLAASFVIPAPGTVTSVDPDLLRSLTVLDVLDIDGSPTLAQSLMNTSSRHVLPMSNLRQLSMRDCDLERLPRPLQVSGLRSMFPRLLMLELTSSRWDCGDPANIHLVQQLLLAVIASDGRFGDENVCGSPPELRGRSIGAVLLRLIQGRLDIVDPGSASSRNTTTSTTSLVSQSNAKTSSFSKPLSTDNSSMINVETESSEGLETINDGENLEELDAQWSVANKEYDSRQQEGVQDSGNSDKHDESPYNFSAKSTSSRQHNLTHQPLFSLEAVTMATLIALTTVLIALIMIIAIVRLSYTRRSKKFAGAADLHNVAGSRIKAAGAADDVTFYVSMASLDGRQDRGECSGSSSVTSEYDELVTLVYDSRVEVTKQPSRTYTWEEV